MAEGNADIIGQSDDDQVLKNGPICEPCGKPITGDKITCEACGHKIHPECSRMNHKRTHLFCATCYDEAKAAAQKHQEQKDAKAKEAARQKQDAAKKKAGSTQSGPTSSKPPPGSAGTNANGAVSNASGSKLQSDEQLLEKEEDLDAEAEKLKIEIAKAKHRRETAKRAEIVELRKQLAELTSEASNKTKFAAPKPAAGPSEVVRVDVHAPMDGVPRASSVASVTKSTLSRLALERAYLAKNLAEKQFRLEELRRLERTTELEVAELSRSQEILAQQEESLRSHSRSGDSLRDLTDGVVLSQDRNKVRFQPMPLKDDYANISTRTAKDVASERCKSSYQFDKGAQFVRQSTPAFGIEKTQVHSTYSGMNFEMSADITQANLIARKATPKELPKFNGDVCDWPMFISTFYETTTRCGFSNQENMLRLREALKGPAYELTKADLIMPSKVPDVLDTLETAFGRPDLVLQDAVEKVREFPEMKTDSLEHLIRLHLLIKGVCSTLQAMGMDKSLNDTYLLSTTIKKMSPGLKREWAKFCHVHGNSDIMGLNEWLKFEAKMASKVTNERILPIESKPKDSKNAKPSTNSRNQPKETLFVNDDQSEDAATKPRTPNCLNCKEQHKIEDCANFLAMDIDSRWQFTLRTHICRRCLAPHSARRCRRRVACAVDGCTEHHHPLLHKRKAASPTGNIPPAEPTPVLTIQYTSTTKTLFRIIPVQLINGNVKITAFAFIDEGSSVTMLEDGLADQLGLQGDREELCLRWTGDTTRNEPNSRRVSIKIAGSFENSRIYNIAQVRTVSNLGLPTQTMKFAELSSKYKYLQGLPVDSYSEAVPRLLIGLAHWSLCVPLEVVQGNLGDPVATKCRLGWAVSGKCYQPVDNALPHFHVCDCQNDQDLHAIVRGFFSIDNFGTGPNKKTETLSNQRSLKLLQEGTRDIGGRFETRLLWKSDEVRFPDSLPMAKRRLQCLVKKMSKDPILRENLTQQMREYLEKGYIRKLTPQEAAIRTPRTWYLPVFAVTNPNKPGKIRMVWDAAATVGGTSLNHELLKGPDMLTPLPEVLFRFRQYAVAVSGDIKEMFHQVQIAVEDRESQRFLWTGTKPSDVETYEMQVMTFGAACSPSAAQYVKNYNADRFKLQYPRAAKAIRESHYVDDFLDSFATEDEAITISWDVSRIHKNAGFLIRDWVSNSTIVRHKLGGEEAVKKDLDVGSGLVGAKVLGLWWDTHEDVLTFAFDPARIENELLDRTRKPTKREVLRLLMMVFDPLGLISHILVQVKILIQELWRSDVQWDQEILAEHQQKWDRWLDAIPLLKQVKLPRCYSPMLSTGTFVKTDLHMFVDASENAFAAVAYLRLDDGCHVDVALIGAKTKVAPQKPTSIPRLELQAAVLGVRLALTLEKSHNIKIHSRTFWTDSSTVLAWLRSNPRKHHQFVSLRIGEILESTELREWRFVPTKENVADEATKWTGLVVDSANRWFTGPPYLQLQPDNWPENRFMSSEEDPATLHHHQISTNVATPDPERFSNWNRLLRTQAWILRVILGQERGRHLSPAELQRAEQELFRTIQRQAYPLEVQTLASGNQLETGNNLNKLTPILDENLVLRVCGRINSKTPGLHQDAINPVILPRDSRVTILILLDYHNRFHHQNHETVVNEVRQRFWIAHLRTTLRQIRNTCQKCRNDAAVPVPPRMSEIPSCRTAMYTKPFTYVGMDYFGPIEISVNRRTEKRWVALFTCLTVRAVHLEIAHDLTSDATVMTIRNLIARRGNIVEIWCDNGTNFRGASKELTGALEGINHDDLKNYFQTIEWKFIPPLSPHMGGCWERLVRSIKAVLAEVMPMRRPREDQLYNYLLEVERIVNSRPLTYIPHEIDEPEALTPNHFLLGSSSGSKPPGEILPPPALYRRMWKSVQQTTDMFWRRWIMEYLPTLTRRTKWFTTVAPLKVGDIGVIWDESIRGSWQKGRIIDVRRSKDDQVRSVVVKTARGVYTRPAVKFAKLDVLPDQSEDNQIPILHGGEDVGRT